jgi:hypothetical protein
MKFSLTEKGRTGINTVFPITDAAGTIVGSANVPHSQAKDLLKCWREPAPDTAANRAGKQARAAQAMVAALRRGPRLSRQGVLRGC